ncbi:hypothetical protein HK103_000425 [Boothiomyces macroporosus]|uniref:RING-type domain-containing protein n=1 Tax=Boothiomyces macroporosus TaxID=261099 RepID=A0AAD5UET5_9FUNG|nr:hypothetical protein HK103_000425 [Boothiomyces macroporosus]
MDDENISSTSTRAFVEDILNVLSLGQLGNLQEIAALGNLYNELPPPPLRKAKTLQSKINLIKSSIQVLYKNNNTEITFKYDSLVPCYISIYFNGRVTFENSSESNLKFNILTENDKPATFKRFGPFPAGLNQGFTTTEDALQVYGSHETVMHVQTNLPVSPTVSPVNVTSPTSATEANPLINRSNIPPPISINLPSQPPEVISPSSINPTALYDIVIVLEEQDPSISHDFQTPYMNAQATSILLKKSDAFEIIYSKQNLLIDGIPYLLQEVYGFSESETDNRNDQVCMSDYKDTLVLPCRHLCLCNSCAEVLRNSQNSPTSPQTPSSRGPPKCPICRQVFHSLVQIKLPPPYDIKSARASRVNMPDTKGFGSSLYRSQGV